jgi:hypothetical protein
VVKKSRGPGVVYSALGLVILVAVATVAFTTRQPPPPTIAEFAPNAVEQIEDAPEEQTSDVGEAAGPCPADEPDCDVPTPTPLAPADDDDVTIDVPRVRKCVGDPPRQIEDPQSPPCVPYWEGDNGGATHKGVTRDEIRIAAPVSDQAGTVRAAAAFFNKRFELYGRKFVVVDTSTDEDCTPEGGRAMAQAAEEQHHIFASNSDACGGDGTVAYSSELARRGLLYVTENVPFGSEWSRRFHPHVWQYPMEADGMFAHMGEWACNRLAGSRARHAGSADLQSRERVFGVILETQAEDFPLDADELTERLAACGSPPKVVVLDPEDGTNANVILQMKTEGVTSIFCLCSAYVESPLYGAAATAQGYFPEWMLSTYNIHDNNINLKAGLPAEQRKSLMGIQLIPMEVRYPDRPAVWACNEVGCDENDYNTGIAGYQTMLLIASGVQMAGPNLTPETFAEGLRKTVFPNPDHPIIAGDVGFDPVVKPDPKYPPAANMAHGMTTDRLEYWWSESALGPEGDTGAMCYVARARYRLGEQPKGTDDVFFSGDCDTGVSSG